MTRQVIEGMREREWGRIINISSINGQKGQMGQTNYSAAKAGMIGFTKALALENAKKGVTVNSIAPGYIDTEMVQAVPEKVLESIIARSRWDGSAAARRSPTWWPSWPASTPAM
jgi:acetoacetyl-CoA reductase